jgi:hypothetical protein
MTRVLCFIVFIFSCALVVHGQVITDRFTLKSGTRNGGCDGRIDLLNQYFTESRLSVTLALNYLDSHGDKDTATGRKVRRALDTFFKISQSIKGGVNNRNEVASMFK